jgi:hypothetical protein
MIEIILKNIGFAGTSTILIIILIFFALFGFKTSHFEFQGLVNWVKNRKKNKQDEEMDDNYYACSKTTEDGSKIGFDIPREFVKICGTSWSREDIKMYRMLEERWEHCNIVDITECNATTTLISLLENKANKFGSLIIYASHEQMKLLTYLQQIDKIKFEVR